MEFLDGETLAKILERQKPLPEPEAGRVASHCSAETGDGRKIGIDGAAADWTLNRFSPETP